MDLMSESTGLPAAVFRVKSVRGWVLVAIAVLGFATAALFAPCPCALGEPGDCDYAVQLTDLENVELTR
jgi:hypothetical protein